MRHNVSYDDATYKRRDTQKFIGPTIGRRNGEIQVVSRHPVCRGCLEERTEVESVCRKLGASVLSREVGVKLGRQLSRGEDSSGTFDDGSRLKIQNVGDGG